METKMVLSDIEIRAEINAKRLIFDPAIGDEDRIGSSSVDLLLHEELLILPERVRGVSIDPSDDEIHIMDILTRHGETKTLSQNDYHTMDPNRLVIGKTLEVVKLPLHLAARIEGKSSLARLGLSVHITAPTVMAGFSGRLYLEMNNVGPFPIQLKAGMKIAQLILEHVGLPALESYSGQFQRQQ
jgi:dCTP deaminase